MMRRAEIRWAGDRLAAVGPGVLLCLAVTGGAWLLQGVESSLFGRAWLEALVLAILLGAVIRTLWTPGPRWASGIDFSAKQLLEVAVMLLGATLSSSALAAGGLALVVGVTALVLLAIPTSYALGRLLGLPHRMSILVACGNAICGNSAIAAVAPVIGADSEDVSASIAFTAVLGVLVVIGLPLLAIPLHLNHRAFGVYAGLTVYAVPQVLAATAPVSRLSAQVGTLVKLMRVLMLGPVVAVLSVLGHGGRSRAQPAPGGARKPKLSRLVPWFIVAFLLLVAARSLGLVPTPAAHMAGSAAGVLTIVSMAALGLGVDVRALAKAGPRVTATVTLSLLTIGSLALLLIRILRVA